MGGSAAAGSEALHVLGQAEPVLNAATRDGVGRPVTSCASCRSQKRKCAFECPGRNELDPAGARTPLLAAAHASAQLGSGADEVTPVGLPIPTAAQADPSIADSAGLTERADGKRTRVRRDLHGEAPECAALRDQARGPKRTRHFGSELAALPRTGDRGIAQLGHKTTTARPPSSKNSLEPIEAPQLAVGMRWNHAGIFF